MCLHNLAFALPQIFDKWTTMLVEKDKDLLTKNLTHEAAFLTTCLVAEALGILFTTDRGDCLVA